jgi:pimeloyl-ACP methyl ester carboxylesterase
MEAEMRYAWNGEISLAYQVLEGPEPSLIYLQGYLSNVELNADHPPFARFLRELAQVARVVVTDRRGLGCSERFTPADTPALEDLLGDVTAVLDAAGCERSIVFATGDCGPLACLFAATYPDRVSGLVLWGRPRLGNARKRRRGPTRPTSTSRRRARFGSGSATGRGHVHTPRPRSPARPASRGPGDTSGCR